MTLAMARFTFIFTSLIALELQLTGQSNAAFGPENARGIWFFDEGRGNIKTKDASSNGNDGEYMGGEKWVPGKFGQALRFDGEDDRLNVGSDASLNPTDALTIVAWIYIERYTAQGGSERTIFQRSNVYRLVILSAAGMEGAVRFGLGEGKVIDTIDGVPLKEWHHVAVAYDGDIGMIYVDGKIAAEKELREKIRLSVNAATTIASGPNGLFKGIVDEVALFDLALSEGDVNRIINRGLQPAIFAVFPLDKLTTIWGEIKVSR
jgi:hypothetical protein